MANLEQQHPSHNYGPEFQIYSIKIIIQYILPWTEYAWEYSLTCPFIAKKLLKRKVYRNDVNIKTKQRDNQRQPDSSQLE